MDLDEPIEPIISTDELGQNDATILVRPAQVKGLMFRVSLFYLSETWIALLHADVKALLDAFVLEYAKPIASTSTTPEESPVEVFKRIWIELGWTRIHALGIAEGPSRKAFAESVLRGFLEQLYDGAEPLRQIGALLAIYSFYSTQPRSALKARISVDSPTLERLLRIPEALSQALDVRNFEENELAMTEAGRAPSKVVPKPSEDIKYVLNSLLSADAFFIIPTESYLFPPLPAVSILDPRQKIKETTAKVLLATEQEMLKLESGILQSSTNDSQSFEHWIPQLRDAEAAYVAEKYNGFTSIFQTPLTQAIINKGQETTYNTLKRLKADGKNAESTRVGEEDFSKLAAKDLFSLISNHGIADAAASFEKIVDS